MRWRNLNDRPKGITLVVILQIINGLFILINFGPLVFILLMFPGFFGFMLPFILIPIFIGIFFIINGRALYIGKGWSWWATIIINILNIMNISYLFMPLISSQAIPLSQIAETNMGLGLHSLIANIICAVITMPYMLRSKTRAYFGKVKIDISDLNTIEPNDVQDLYDKSKTRAYFGKVKIDISDLNTIEPNDVQDLYDKGLALDNLGKYNEAIDCYDNVLRIDPNEVNALNSKGVSLRKLGKYNEAIDCYDNVLRIDPDHTAAKHNKQIALEQLGKNKSKK
jgi:hypothetical protein